MQGLSLSVTDQPDADLWSRIEKEVNSFGGHCLAPYQLRHVGTYFYLHEELVGGCNGLLIETRLHVTGLWTSSSLRRQGIAKKLFQEMIVKAKGMGCRTVFLDTENDHVKTIVEDAGFFCLAVIPGFLPEKLRAFFSKEIE